MPITAGLLLLLDPLRNTKKMPVNSTSLFLKRLKEGKLKTSQPIDVFIPATEAKDPEIQIPSSNSSPVSTGFLQNAPASSTDVPTISGREAVAHLSVG